ncbi:phage exclusion protein Lit family protein [Roseovarius sp.]|uniref:phage exclusion protein Lit family protein n=1 Tax=Roseovarius sp. TaxID=1486281 RepID=UPI00356A14DC
MAEDGKNQDQPTLGSLFEDYEPEIRAIFARAFRERGLTADKAPRLEFTETRTTMLFRCVPSERRVLADWRGIASLWAMSQALGRLSPAMFNARRNGAERIDLTDGSEELLGHQFIGYAKELCVPQPWRWNTYFPKPDRNADSGAAQAGDIFFFRSIEWILRHEIGHIALNHGDSAWSAEQSRAEEREADQYATRGLKGDLAADADRAPGTRPSDQELELERRVLAAGIGLLWVGIYEDTGPQTNDLHPPLSDRMFRSLEEFDLAPDSAALEVLSDFIKAWIDPEAVWPAKPVEEATAKAVMDEAFSRLDDYARKARG